MAEEIQIKMGTKSGTQSGLTPAVIHTGKMSESKPILQVSKVGSGLDAIITERKDEVKKIEVDSAMMHKLISACAEDLMTPRIISVPTSINSTGKEELKFVSEYDQRNIIFKFEKDINYFNKVFNFKDGDLADFLSNFFYSNIGTYCENLFGGIPSILPTTSMSVLQNNRVVITIH